MFRPLGFVSAALIGALSIPVAWNAATNTPALTSSTAPTGNNCYVVTVAGNTALDGETEHEVGDILYFDGVAGTWEAIRVNPIRRVAYASLGTGEYVGQRKQLTNYGVGNGLVMEWLAAAAWGYLPQAQLLACQHTPVSCDANALEKVLFSCNVPPLRGNDQLLIRLGWTYTNSANNKTEKLKLGGSTVYNQSFTTTAGDVRDLFVRNRGATNAQILGFGNATVYGSGSQAPTTAALETNAGGLLEVTGQKTSGGEAMTLEFADVHIIGGGT